MKRIVFIAGIFAAFSLLSSCGESSEGKLSASDMVKNPNTASKDGKEVSMPVISFEKTEHDFGKLMLGESVTYSFKFTNNGSSDLIITAVKASCGCTIAKYNKEPIKPGESDFITVSFDSNGRHGVQNKGITVMSNTQPSKTILRIKANVMIP